MNRPLIVRAAAVVLLLVALAALGIPAVFAVPPANDDFDSALVVGGLPFNDAQDTREATVADDDPSPFCGGRTATVWYAFTPASDQRIEINTAGSSYPTSVAVYSGARGALGFWTCGGTQVNFTAQAGNTYYFMIGSLSGGGYPGPGDSAGGDLVVSVSQVPAPANDDFDAALAIPALPFTDSNRDTRAATTAADDPTPSCAPATREATVWYTFTPAQAQGIEVNTFGTAYATSLSVYTGARGALAEVACGGAQTIFAASAGQAYYIMVGSDAGAGGALFLAAQGFDLPPNDDFDSALVIPALPFNDARDTRGASVAGDDPVPTCGISRAASVWYALTPAEALLIDISLAGSSYGAGVAVFTGARGALTEVACGSGQVRFPASAGATYYLMVGGEVFFGSPGGNLVLSVQGLLPPANDDFDAAAAITGLPFTDSRDTRAATMAADDPDCFGREATVWYTFTPAQDARIEVSTQGSNFGASLSAYTGSRGSLTALGCTTTAFPGPLPVLRLDVTAGTPYFFMIGATSCCGFPAAGGSLSLTVEALTVPGNDDFDAAAVIGGLPFTDSLDTRGARPADDDPAGCGGSALTVWYAFTPTERMRVEANTFGSSYNATLAVLTGARGALSLVTCSGNIPGPFGEPAQVRFEAQAGRTYYFMVGAGGFFAPLGGSLVFNVNPAPAGPPNDFFEAATLVTLPAFSESLDTREATVAEADPFPSCGGREASVWHTLTPAADTLVDINTFASNYSVVLSVFTGAPGALSQVACGFGQISLNLAGGTTYFLMAGTFGGPGANLALNVQQVPPPANDDFADAVQITALPFTDSRDTRAATAAPGDPAPSCAPPAATVWYAFTPAQDQRVEFNTFGSSYSPSLAVFTGGPGAFAEAACTTTNFLRFSAAGGTTYYVAAGGQGGALTLNGLELPRPANDDLAAAEVIPAFPFTINADTRGATTDPTDPIPSCSGAHGREASIWYTFAPAEDQRIDVAGFFSDYQVVVSVFTGSPGALTEIACGGLFPQISFGARAGRTYFIMLGGAPGGAAALSLVSGPLAANDDFPNATPIAALPFSEAVDLTGTSREAGEPAPSCAAPTRSVWYKFTPTTTQSLTAGAGFPAFPVAIAVYTGRSLSRLTEVACRTAFFGGGATFRAQKGKTYYIQVETAGMFGSGGPVQFTLDVAPGPTAGFTFSPGDPSVFDEIQFTDASVDPAGLGFQEYRWSFGDGTTGAGCCPAHRYGADGDYAVRLTVRTPDGRQATARQIIQVRTHDVAITRVAAPASAQAGQTRTITVDVRNMCYPETVEVQLLKVTPGGVEVVGALTKPVPVRSDGRPTSFAFSYTFTGDDAAAGRVTFQAVAALIGARDAQPADNEASAPPTRVRR